MKVIKKEIVLKFFTKKAFWNFNVKFYFAEKGNWDNLGTESRESSYYLSIMLTL